MQFFILILSLLTVNAEAFYKKTHNKPNLGKVNLAYKNINQNYIKKVKPIFKRTCFNCHGNNTKYPWYYKLPLVKQLLDHDIKEAKAHINFSNNFPFKSKHSPLEDLEEIKEVIDENEMPPFLYKIMHADSKLTKQEITIIKNWIKKSIQDLK